VQFSLEEEAVWMTERDKLMAKAMGKGYLDMWAGPLTSTMLQAHPNLIDTKY
jgi:hypothetical protein